MVRFLDAGTIWTFDPALFAGAFGLIFLAELPDKTAVATMLLATRRRPLAVFLGAAGAFAVQSFVAVAFGGVLSLLPARAVRAGAGLLFLGFAWAMWTGGGGDAAGVDGAGDGESFARAAAASFAVIFVAEWGDLTQLATAALAARERRPLTVFLGATAALWCVAALAVAAGRQLKGRFEPRRLEKAAAVVFALTGLYFLLKAGAA
ncbi:MAG TPA: TMEM165/GDT1 family protein [Elusimicrobiota bacterium]|jgi:putative Ca2+/H+ antiporter (TMEM165/GDT1 family)|nr:TMEM165/GDT1 family protein [Elusimicrobiota bacterium]